MSALVRDLQEVDKSQILLVGGKGANLGELSKLEGVRVPEGFCVTTAGYESIIEKHETVRTLLKQLMMLKVEDREQINDISRGIRRAIEEADIPFDIVEAITQHLSRIGEEHTYAIRSSATAEDLPNASFAGQQDTYLNIMGRETILRHIRKCWASLYTDRAVIYRMKNGFEHHQVSISVIVQRMVFPKASGILFTADPVTCNRKILSIDAGFGLGEALVSGLVSADHYKVRDSEGEIIEKRIATKSLAVYGRKEGGTEARQVDPAHQQLQTLTDQQIVELAHIGREIEGHFGQPQDIEWCLAEDEFFILQSRPITTLYPIPEVSDQENHVYVSVGHQQMMTDAIKPLGLSFFLLTTRAPMRTAGGRLFVDVTPMLASPDRRTAIVEGLGQSDPLMKDALLTIIERGDIIPSLPTKETEPSDSDALDEQGKCKSRQEEPFPSFQAFIDNDPDIVVNLIQSSQASIEELKQTIQLKSASELFDFIREDIKQLTMLISDQQSMGVIITAQNALLWINERMYEWLGEKNAADTLSQSVQNNITSEMGLALLDVADVIRPYPAITDYLQRVTDESFLDGLVKFAGGQEARDAISDYLYKYGMRCVGEIDITRTRWSEKPSTLIPMILSNIKNFAPNESRRRFEHGREEALRKERELLERLKQLPDGEQKSRETKRVIDFIRNFSGYREYPKYAMMNRYFVYKQAIMKEVERLIAAGVMDSREDSYFLTFEELHEAVRIKQVDRQLIHERKEAHKYYEKLTPPRVMTSEGEIISGKYKRQHLPSDAMIGLPVSSGTIEGRARIIFNVEDADLEAGDILVTSFTDPSWTPLFVSIKGLVTEVGGLMTHGAVIAREYGLPAVVGVDSATKLIKEGQRIRVNGTEGYIEIIDKE